MSQYCGYISIIGRPNVGKSTLLNRVLGQKLSITSRKPQTTRHQIEGIKTLGDYQMIYVDTPGIHSNSKNAMNHYMNQAAKSSISGVNVILFMVDALKWTKEDEKIAKFLGYSDVPVIFVINKIDWVKDKNLLLPFIVEHTKNANFVEVLPISALKGSQVDDLEEIVKKYMPKLEHIYDADDYTTRSSKFLVAERIREKLMRRLGEELPYSLTVSIDAFEIDKGIYKIAATIWVNRTNQKGIVIGKNGAMLKSVGHDSRIELEDIFGAKVFLKLWVKVREGWANDLKALQSLGYSDDPTK